MLDDLDEIIITAILCLLAVLALYLGTWFVTLEPDVRACGENYRLLFLVVALAIGAGIFSERHAK